MTSAIARVHDAWQQRHDELDAEVLLVGDANDELRDVLRQEVVAAGKNLHDAQHDKPGLEALVRWRNVSFHLVLEQLRAVQVVANVDVVVVKFCLVGKDAR